MIDDAIGHQEDCQIERERRIAGGVRGQDLTALCGEFVDQRRTELGAAIDIIVSTSRRPGTGVAPSAQAVRFTDRLLAEQARMNSRCPVGADIDERAEPGLHLGINCAAAGLDLIDLAFNRLETVVRCLRRSEEHTSELLSLMRNSYAI